MQEAGKHRTNRDPTFADAILETVGLPLLALDANLRVEVANDAFLRRFQVTRGETVGRLVYELGNGQWNIPELRTLFEDILMRESWVEDYCVEHTFPHIGRRIMRLNAKRIHRPESLPPRARDSILLAIADETEREELRAELEGRIEFADKLVNSVREGLLILRSDLSVHSANQSFYEMFNVRPAEMVGRPISKIGNGQWDTPELHRLLEDILPREKSFDDYKVEHDFDGLGRRVMLLNGRRLDHIDFVILAIRDVTTHHDEELQKARAAEASLRESEQHLKVLLNEVNHRSKNMLAIVQAIARQTAATSPGEFIDRFFSRIQALAAGQDLIVKADWKGVAFAELVRSQLAHFQDLIGTRIKADGPPLLISPAAAQTLGMAIHELATNAGKYGSLSNTTGGVSITWSLEPVGAGKEIFSLGWRELDGPAVSPPARHGFGSTVTGLALESNLDAKVDREFTKTGLTWRLRCPAEGILMGIRSLPVGSGSQASAA